jgi:methylase of polypeptide subunit release factors
VLQVTPPTLIPRHETEDWALWTADKLKFESLAGRKEAITGLDLCTGTGCIPLLLAAELPPRSFSALAIDVSPSAVDLARRNANLVSPNTRSNSVEFVQADLFSPNIVSFLRSHPLYPFDVITSNPPYLSHREWKALGGSVKSYEDSLALIGEPPPHDTSPSTSFEQPSSLTSPSDPFSIKTSLASVNAKGLAFYDRIAHILHLAPDILKADGLLVVEVGKDQAFDVQAIFERALCSSSCDPDGPVDRGEGISAITSRGHGERQEGRRGTEVRNKKQVPAQFFVRDDYNSIGRTVWGRVPSPQKASSSCISIGDDS